MHFRDSDKNWHDFYHFTGRFEFINDVRFQSLADRTLQIEVLYAMIAEEAPKRTTAEWVEFCDKVSIPCMPVLALDGIRPKRPAREGG